jgi:environmental stress-induced protein Ves
MTTTTSSDAPLPTRVIRFHDLAPRPWRNGGGITRDIAGHSDGRDEVMWRVSVADVDTSGNFSEFRGLDRILMLCRGTNMQVTVDDAAHLLQPWDIVRFSGEANTRATLLDGPTVDLNIMTSRRAARATVALMGIDGGAAVAPPEVGTTTLLVAVEGHMRCRAVHMVETRLDRFDTIHLTADSESVDVAGAGRMVRIDVEVLR